MTTIDICPACGYPTIGVVLCAFCIPVQAMSGLHQSVSIPGAGQPRFTPGRPVSILPTKLEVAEAIQALQAG